MKNKLSILLVLAVFMFIALGCGIFSWGSKKTTSGGKSTQPTSSDSNKSLTDKTIEDVADGETTGVQECDDFIRFLKAQSEKPDDNWVTKGMRDYFIGLAKKQIKQSVDENKTDKKKMAEQCTDAKKSFEKSLKEQQEKEEKK